MVRKPMLKLFNNKHLIFGGGVQFRSRFNVISENGGLITIGKNCFFNNDCSLTCRNKIQIGEGTIFGENVKIYDHNHRFRNSNMPIKEQGYSEGEVLIGSHCWIGSNVVILKGTIIGDNCVIGAGCVVSGNVPNDTIMKVDCGCYIFEKIKHE